MDRDTEREIRLNQLAQRLLSGEMTEEERREYDTLQNEQSRARDNALARLAQLHVERWFKRLKLP